MFVELSGMHVEWQITMKLECAGRVNFQTWCV